MKRVCICLCCVLLALTACGRPASVEKTEAVAAVTESLLPQTQTESGTVEPETVGLQTESQTETQTEPFTTEPQRETPTESTATTAATTGTVQTTRETHTLFTTPARTTGAKTTTAKPTTTRPTTTTTVTTTKTTTTTTQSSGSYSGYVMPVTPSSATTAARKTCTVTIDCRELRDHPEKLKTPEKSAFVPKSGYIVKNVTMEFQDGESVYDVLRRVCATHTCTDNCRFCQAEGIQMESTYTPQFDSYYVEGIHQLYEKDCGGTSGWTYWVNGRFPNYGSSDCIVKPGDRIEWIYSIEMDANETFD